MHAHADGWYVCHIEGVDTANLVFHDQHGRQTADLHRERDGWMDRDGQWRDAAPEPLVRRRVRRGGRGKGGARPAGPAVRGGFPCGDHLLPDHHPVL